MPLLCVLCPSFSSLPLIFSSPPLSWLECPNMGPITVPAQPSLHLIIKHFLHLTQKIAEALLRAARAQLTVEEMPRVGVRTGWKPLCHHSISPFPLPWGFSCMWLGKSSPVISEDSWIKTWSSAMVAFGEESWLKQRSPPTSNTHTFIYSKLSKMFYPLREKYTIPVSPQISQNDRLSLQKGVYMEHLMSGIVFP